jgi:hypothetical protein
MMISSSFENLLIGFLTHSYLPCRSIHSIALTHTLFLACTVTHFEYYTYLGCILGISLATGATTAFTDNSIHVALPRR